MNIVKVPIDKVVPWEHNPRGIKAKDYERLKKQILKLGVYKPLLAYKENGHYVVLGGNMRIRALKELGIPEVEVSVVEAKTQAKKIEYALSDNDRAGFYEEDKLAELVYPEIANLDLAEFKVDLGEPLDLKAVVERYGPDIDDGADDVPEVDDTPAVTKVGDLFTLGRHRVMCGDSTKADDVARLMRGEKAELVVTSPPYDNNEDYEKGDDRETWLNLIRGAVANSLGTLADGGLVALNMGNRVGRNNINFCASCIESCGGVFMRRVVWKKPDGAGIPSHGHTHKNPIGLNWHPMMVTEDVLVYSLGPRRAPVQSARFNTDLFSKYYTDCWQFPGVHSDQDQCHPAAFPVLLPELCMAFMSIDGDSVLDPFLGSGTTLIAAEKLGRVCYGMEIDPKYCDVIIRRYCDYTGTDEPAVRATRENPNA